MALITMTFHVIHRGRGPEFSVEKRKKISGISSFKAVNWQF